MPHHFETARRIIRPFRADDTQDIVRLVNDPDMCRGLAAALTRAQWLAAAT